MGMFFQIKQLKMEDLIIIQKVKHILNRHFPEN